jgi:hypothetical protein
MVRMGMREHYDVDAFATSRPKKWSQDESPRIRSSRHRATAIHQHQSTVGEVDEQSISLADVRRRDPEHPVGCPVAPCHPFEDAERKYRRSQNGPPRRSRR